MKNARLWFRWLELRMGRIGGEMESPLQIIAQWSALHAACSTGEAVEYITKQPIFIVRCAQHTGM